MPTKKETQLDYFMDVVMRNYCRAAEENEILFQELEDMRSCVSTLFKENADLRFALTEAGLDVPVSEFDTDFEDASIDSSKGPKSVPQVTHEKLTETKSKVD